VLTLSYRLECSQKYDSLVVADVFGLCIIVRIMYHLYQKSSQESNRFSLIWMMFLQAKLLPISDLKDLLFIV